MRIVIFLFIGLFFCSCSERCYHCDLGKAIIFEHAKEMEKAYPCFLGGYGGSFFDKHVNELDVNLTYSQEVNIEIARSLMINGVEQFLKSVNNNQSIRAYLVHYPFTYKDLIYSMDFFSETGDFVPEHFVAYVSLVKGNIYYSIYNKKTKMLDDLAQEPYLEALEKVKNTNEKNLLSTPNPT